jgi:hypothetical protein
MGFIEPALFLTSCNLQGFEKYVDNSLRQFTCPSILKLNLSRVKHIDEIVRTLIKNRYTNLHEYKSKIQSCTNLPSYLQTLLIDNNYYAAPRTASITSPRWFTPTFWDSTPSTGVLNGRTTKQQSPTGYNQSNQSKTLTDYCGINDIINKNGAPPSSCTISPKEYLQSPKAKLNFLHQAPSPRTPTTFNFNQMQQSIQVNPIEHIWSTNTDNTPANNAPLSPTSFYTSHTPAPIQVKTTSTSSSSTNSSQNQNGEYHNLLQDSHTTSYEEAIAKYMRHSAFISSPIANRLTCFNKSNNTDAWKSNASGNLISFSDYTNAQPTRARHNSSIDQSSLKFNALYNNCSNDVFINASPNGSCSSGGGNLIVKSQPGLRSKQKHGELVWSGRLPPKFYPENSVYSRKVFLGGVPWDADQNSLLTVLHKYGSVRFDVPGKDQKHPRISKINERSTPGYTYVTFEHESSVQKLLNDCRFEKDANFGDEYYFYSFYTPSTQSPNAHQSLVSDQIHSNKRGGKMKEIEIVPWNQEDISFVPKKNLSPLPPKIDPQSTIFVGAIHGMVTSQALAMIMTELFGEVIHAGLDTDKYKYPIGSGRVTFRDRQSYVEAIKAKFVNIKALNRNVDKKVSFLPQIKNLLQY